MRKFAAVIGVIIGLAVVPRVADASPIGTNGCALVGGISECDIYIDPDVDGASELDGTVGNLGGYLPGYVLVLNALADLSTFEAADVAHILVIHDQLFQLFSNSAANFGFAGVFTAATTGANIDGQPISSGQIAGCPPVPSGVPQIDGVGYCFNQDLITLAQQIAFVDPFTGFGGNDTLRIHTALPNGEPTTYRTGSRTGDPHAGRSRRRDGRRPPSAREEGGVTAKSVTQNPPVLSSGDRRVFSCTPHANDPNVSGDRERDQQRPADKKRQATQRGDHPELRHAGQRERVQTAGKEDDAEGERPTRGANQPAVKPSGRDRNDQHRERVVDLVADAGVEHREHLRRQPATQCVRPEGTERHGDESRQRTNEQERAIHAVIVWPGPRYALEKSIGHTLRVVGLPLRERGQNVPRSIASNTSGDRWPVACPGLIAWKNVRHSCAS